MLPGLLLARRGAAQTNQVRAKPPLTHVTVCLNGTTLEHRGEVTLAAGPSRLRAASKALADSLTRMQAAMHRTEAELLGLQQEKTFLLGNQTLPTGTQANWSAEVQKGAALTRTPLPAIQLETERLTVRLKVLKEADAPLQVPPATGPTLTDTPLALAVRVIRAGTMPLTIRYFVSGRGRKI